MIDTLSPRTASCVVGAVGSDTAATQFIWVAPQYVEIVGVSFQSDTAITADGSNNLVVLVEKLPLGVVASKVTLATSGTAASTDWVAKMSKDLTLSATAANLKLVAGDVLQVTCTPAGTAATTVASVQVKFIAGEQA